MSNVSYSGVTGLRYEVKLVVPTTALHKLQLAVRRHSSGFRVHYPPRRINNFYFDSPTLAAYSGSVQGAHERSKLRVRWYGVERRLPAAATVEIKRRRAGIGWKHRWKLKALESFMGSPPGVLLQTVPEPGGRDLRELLGMRLRPVLFNCYDRDYFISADNRCRLTIDSNLGFAPYPGAKSRQTPRTDRLQHHLCVVELKAAAANRACVVRALDGLGRSQRFSKYALGMELQGWAG